VALTKDQLNAYKDNAYNSQRSRPDLKREEDGWGKTLLKEGANAVLGWGKAVGSGMERFGDAPQIRHGELLDDVETVRRGGEATESRSLFSRALNGPLARHVRDFYAKGSLAKAAFNREVSPQFESAVRRGEWDRAEDILMQTPVKENPFLEPVRDSVGAMGRRTHNFFDGLSDANQPNVRGDSAKEYVGNMVEHLGGTVLPGAAIAYATRGKALAPLISGAQSAVSGYSDALRGGENYYDASNKGNLHGAIDGTISAIMLPGRIASRAMFPVNQTARKEASEGLKGLGEQTRQQTDNGAPYPDGTRLSRGGELYEVRNGVPVPLED
jgi:hypothetical protein